jgi:ribosomal protein S18 acetylase RimI-like enzyme
VTTREAQLLTAVVLRDASDEDEDFLRGLYLDLHPEFAGLPPDQRDGLVRLQLTAQRRQYGRDHPLAQDRIIEVDGEPVGRCWTAEEADAIRLLDLAVLTAAQRRGVATAVLTGLCDRAAATGRVVRLFAWTGNESARRLYEGLGFRSGREEGGYLAFQWG